MLRIGVSFFLSISRAVCYRMIDWKKGIELLNESEKALKSLELLGLLVQEPCEKAQLTVTLTLTLTLALILTHCITHLEMSE